MKHEQENQTTGTLHLDLASIRRRLDERRERFVRLRAQQRRERDQLSARPWTPRSRRAWTTYSASM